jgi:hypothetical protein
MTALAHSRLPWRLQNVHGDLFIRDADGEIIIELNNEVHARLIVAAVNSHAELLAAAKAVSLAFMSLSAEPHPQHAVLLAVDAAIANAEKNSQ